jgi:hypothetical protein
MAAAAAAAADGDATSAVVAENNATSMRKVVSFHTKIPNYDLS